MNSGHMATMPQQEQPPGFGTSTAEPSHVTLYKNAQGESFLPARQRITLDTITEVHTVNGNVQKLPRCMKAGDKSKVGKVKVTVYDKAHMIALDVLYNAFIEALEGRGLDGYKDNPQGVSFEVCHCRMYFGLHLPIPNTR